MFFKDAALGLALGLGGAPGAGIHGLQLVPCVEHEVDDLPVFLPLCLILPQCGEIALGAQPAAHALLGVGSGEGFVEVGVSGDEDLGVGELVEDELGEVVHRCDGGRC
jgi:hypothetical protein